VATSTKPWERQSNESPQAYAAFEFYLSLGKDRNVVDAYRQRERKPDAKQADGTWNKWAKIHRWVDRARHYDNREMHAFEQGVAKEAERAGRTYAELRDRVYREGIERWEKRLKQSDLIAAMPLTAQTIQRDGQHVTVDPVSVLDHYRALMMASQAQQRLVDLLDRGLDLERDDAAKLASEALPMQSTTPPPDLESAAPNKLDTWRAWQRTQVIRIRRTDPREDESGNGQGNGHANGATH
jgi:hypothetical protein